MEFDRSFYLNEPDDSPSGTLIFKNDGGETLRARLSEADVTGFSTDRIGEREMRVSVGGQTLDVPYTVTYKAIYFDAEDLLGAEGALRLSVGGRELDDLYLYGADYDDVRAGRIPVSELEWENIDTEDVTSFEQTARAEYYGQEVTFSYTVGYIGYGYRYTGNAEDFGVYYEVTEFVLDEDGGGSLEIGRVSDSYFEEDLLFSGNVIWEEPDFTDESVLPIYDAEMTDLLIGEYDFRRGELAVYPDVAGNDVILDIPLTLHTRR